MTQKHETNLDYTGHDAEEVSRVRKITDPKERAALEYIGKLSAALSSSHGADSHSVIESRVCEAMSRFEAVFGYCPEL